MTHALEKMASGNFGSTKPVGSGVHELRIDFGAGYRICFANAQGRIVIFLGGTKRRQQRDISAALRNWMEYKARKG